MSMIQNLDTKFTQSVILVTPDMAARWLEQNVRNRVVAQAVIDRYAADMLAGRWVFDGSPIRFATDGTLIDGQHRLYAVTQSGVSLPFAVQRGLPVESQQVMDQGRRRTTGQQLSIHGIKNYNIIASGARGYLTHKDGLMFRDNKVSAAHVTTARIQQFVLENMGLVDWTNAQMTNIRNIDAPPSVIVTALWMLAERDSDEAQEFIRLVACNAAPVGSGPHALVNRLARVRREGQKVTNRDCLAMFIQAWNAWRQGRSVSKLQRPSGGAWTSETFPEAI